MPLPSAHDPAAVWSRFAARHPDVAAGLDLAVEQYDARFSTAWQDDDARALKTRITTGAITFADALTGAHYVLSSHHLAEQTSSPHPNTAKRRIGLAAVSGGWTVRREPHSYRDDFYLTKKGRRRIRVAFSVRGGLTDVSYTKADGSPRSLTGAGKTRFVLDYLQGSRP